jgi:hypothetical protein
VPFLISVHVAVDKQRIKRDQVRFHECRDPATLDIRTPVIVHPDGYDLWLDLGMTDVEAGGARVSSDEAEGMLLHLRKSPKFRNVFSSNRD